MARLSFRCDEELLRRVDKARGLIAREVWLRAVVEAATYGPVPGRQDVERALGLSEELEAHTERLVAEYEADSLARYPARVRSSAEVRRDVRPVPKGKP